MSTHEITADGFETFVHDNTVALVDFSATWCGPCQQIKPVLHELAQEYAPRGAAIGIVDVDEQPSLTARFRISAVPTLVFFKQGEAVGTLQGAVEREVLTEQLDSLLVDED